MSKSQAIADIGIALMGALGIAMGWQGEGYVSKLLLIYGGVMYGYIVTVYLTWEE
jgi:hypothetical protein